MTTHAFTTRTGITVPAVSTAQMREVDRLAVEEVGPTLQQMMENAGRNLAEMCVELLGDGWTSRRIVVVAGTGGDGGGGMCAARHLLNHGGQVTAVTTDASRLSGVPAQQFALAVAAGGRVARVDDVGGLEPDLVVDAVLGYSLTGAPRHAAEALIGWMASGAAPVLSLDVPSGIDAATGEAAGAFANAMSTMTLALPTSGLDSTAVGRLWLADMRIPKEVYRRIGVHLPPALFTGGYRVELAPVGTGRVLP